MQDRAPIARLGRSAALPLCAIAAVVCGLGWWWLNHSTAGSHGDATASTAALAWAQLGESGASPLGRGLDSEALPPKSLANSTRVAMALEPSVTFDDASPLRVRVVTDRALPSDERLEMVVEVISYTVAEADDYALLASLSFFEGEDDMRAWREVARARPLADGTFEVPRPTGVSAVRLSVSGDYIYGGRLEYRVDDPDAPGDELFELGAKVGAHVTLLLNLEGLATPTEIAALEGDKVTLESFDRRDSGAPFVGSPFARTGRVSPDGVVVLRGLMPFSWTTPSGPWTEGADALAPFVLPANFQFDAEPGERMQVHVPMERGQRFQGTIVDRAGEPIEQASVTVTDETTSRIGRRSRSFSRTTDAAGRFVFEAIPPGSDSIQVKAPGHLARDIRLGEAAPLFAAQGPVVLALDAGETLRVRALGADGLPAAGLWLTLKNDTPTSWRSARRLRTDAEGIATFDAIPEGHIRLSAAGRLRPERQREPGVRHIFEGPNYGPRGPDLEDCAVRRDLWCCETTLAPEHFANGEVHELQVGLAPLVHVRVLGIDPNWTEPTEVSIFVSNGSSGSYQSPRDALLSMQLAASTGTLACQLPPGAYVAVASSGERGFGSRTRLSPGSHMTPGVAFEVLASDVQLDLNFGASVAIQGHVRTEDGTLLPGVDVQLSSESSGDWYIPAASTATTDSRGHFGFAPQPPGVYEVRLRADRFISQPTRLLRIVPGRVVELLELRAVAAGALRVQIRTQTGTLRDADQPAIRGAGSNLSTSRRITKDAEWSGAHGPLAAGEYRVSTTQVCQDGTEVLLRGTAHVAPGAVTELTLQEAHRPTALVRGAVTSGGEQARGIAVWLRDDLGTAASCRTDDAGHFTLATMSSGSLVLGWGESSWAKFGERDLVVPPGESTVAPFDLPTGLIHGYVSGEMQWSMFPVLFQEGSGPDAEPFRRCVGLTNEYFRFPYVPDGVYELTSLRGPTRRDAHSKVMLVTVTNGAAAPIVHMQP